MEIEFDRLKKEIRIDGEYAGYIDNSDCYLYETEKDQGDTVIRISEVVKIDPPITRDNGTLLTEIKAPIMILRLKEK